ncbi:peptide-methionine (S)-S-oxide reductase [Ulvibacterium marinum]|uniref:peptide-methionine (S)-S-oxide reductase n=1 Tax=Ulvibacterium marinum TaxID=2419782 RepID=A0A3B0C5L2_9FLAO|nr:peptide-methionine (S)-S-oxide reductase [Ulvibacterium marinum]RKN81705.1 peptide methionine sulfoxide reductase [Ulvibacterium marinum]
MSSIKKIAFGGGCHWCTEAVFQSLKGVERVEQGFVASEAGNETFSEAVIISFFPNEIALKDLVLIHLFTHESTADHSFRSKYRSAIYTIDPGDKEKLESMWGEFQAQFKKKLITKILPFKAFYPSDEMFHSYYYSNPAKPFCKKYIDPKLKLLREKFSRQVVPERMP